MEGPGPPPAFFVFFGLLHVEHLRRLSGSLGWILGGPVLTKLEAAFLLIFCNRLQELRHHGEPLCCTTVAELR